MTRQEATTGYHAARIACYLITSALWLVDLGSYTLLLANLSRATPAIMTLGLIDGTTVCTVPPASMLLQPFARRSGIELSQHAQWKLGLLSSDRQNVIGELIASAPERELSPGASELVAQSHQAPRRIIPRWRLRHALERLIGALSSWCAQDGARRCAWARCCSAGSQKRATVNNSERHRL